jgi:hypothetical protein
MKFELLTVEILAFGNLEFELELKINIKFWIAFKTRVSTLINSWFKYVGRKIFQDVCSYYCFLCTGTSDTDPYIFGHVQDAVKWVLGIFVIISLPDHYVGRECPILSLPLTSYINLQTLLMGTKVEKNCILSPKCQIFCFNILLQNFKFINPVHWYLNARL